MASDNNCNEPLPEVEVKKVVDTWIDLAKIPTVAGAYIREDDNFLNVITKWSVTDAAKKDGVSFSRTYSVLKESLGSGNPIISTPGPVTVDEKMSIVAKSGQKKAVLVEKGGDGNGGSKTEYLQIWSEDTLLKTYNLGELDLHKSIYTHAGWGVTMAWSQSENKLAYLAEKKVPNAKSFYTTAAVTKPKEESEKDDKEKDKAPIGEEFAFKQTWGEKLTGQNFSVIVVLDLDSNEFKVLQLPEEQFPTDIQWVCDTHIVGTSYPIPIWRYGLMACSNRESVIFSIQADGENFRAITEAGKSCRSPRVRPDGSFVVWQERILDGAHDRARSINGIALNKGQTSGEPTVIHESAPKNGMPVYQDFSRNCWSTDGTTLFAVTPNEGIMICLAITIAPSAVTVTKIDHVDSLFWITKDYVLVSSSTTLSSPKLNLLRISQDFQPVGITQSISPIEFQTLKEFVYGEASPPSIFYGPAITSVEPNSVPMIIVPHGGPHASYVDSFSRMTVFFLKLGFAVLRLNFIGSTGGVRDTADELLGKVGDRDVKDCQGMVEKVLNSMPSLNPKQVGVFGGSHGGYLACHLSSAYPDAYKASVAVNPVTDFATMVGTSDIVDWIYAEAGVTLPDPPIQTLIPTARNLVDAEKFIKASPIHHVDKVKAATLLLLGSEDLRVPSQQGLNYYRALKANNKVAEIRMYPDNHSLLKPAVELDFMIHSALWFKRYVR